MDKRMNIGGLDPLEQVTHQFRYTSSWWSHVKAISITIEHTDSILSIMSGMAHQVFHHQSMSLQQVFLFEGIQL